MIAYQPLSPAALRPPPTRVILSRPGGPAPHPLTTAERTALATAAARGTLLASHTDTHPCGAVLRVEMRAWADPHTGAQRYSVEAWVTSDHGATHELTDYADLFCAHPRRSDYAAAWQAATAAEETP